MVQKIIRNAGWLTFDKFLQLVVSFFIGIWVARYLGPSDFGIISFAIAFGALFSPLVGLGINQLVVKELVDSPKNKNKLIGTAFFVNFITGAVAFIVIIFAILMLRADESLLVLVVIVFSLGYLVSPFDIIARWFESRLEAKKVVISVNVAIIIASILKVYFILFSFNVLYFAIISFLETIFRITILFMFYKKSGESIFSWQFDFSLLKRLLSLSWPLILSGAMVMIYLKIDQVMIEFMLDTVNVGVYAVSVKLSELFFFVPGVITASLFPSLIKLKLLQKEKYMYRLQKLLDFMTWSAIIIIIPVSIFANYLVFFLYGQEFISAGAVLTISIFSLLGISIKFAIENFLISEGETKIIFINALLGAITNVLLNILLIPTIGILGAAIATVISYTLSAYFGVLLFSRTRKIFFMLLKSFNLIRLIKQNIHFFK